MYAYLASTFDEMADDFSSAAEFSVGDFYGSFIQVIVVLAVIIGLIVLVIRFLAAKSKGWSKERSVYVHAAVALGQNKSLQVVEIGGTVYIVGVGDDISLLDKIDDPERADMFLSMLEAKDAASSASSLGELSQRLMRRFRRNDEGPEMTEQQNKELFRELLERKLKDAGSRREAVKAWMEEEDR